MTEIQNQVLDHPRNELIHFEKDAHTYEHLPSGEMYNGVTSLISNYAEDFDKEGIAFAVARKEGTTKEKILAKWRRKGNIAIEYGNQVHDMIEDYNNLGVVPDDDENFDAYLTAIDEFGLEPVCSEWVIFDERIKRASAIDGVYSYKGQLVLVDYKTNEDFDKLFYVYNDKRFFYPISELPESKFNKYQIQLNIYHKILTDLYDVPLRDEMFVMHIRDGVVRWLPIVKLRNQVDKLYEEELALIA